jgi:DNA-binding MarR family transcriptional regulator
MLLVQRPSSARAFTLAIALRRPPMSSEALKKAHSLRGLKPALKQLLIHLSWSHQPGKPLIQTYQQMARALSSSTRTVCRHLGRLEALNYIRRHPARLPGNRHLMQVELIFLEKDREAKPRQKATPDRRRIQRQNGFPLNRGTNTPLSSPCFDQVKIDAREEPGVFRDCWRALGVFDWEARARINPVTAFRTSLVERARRKSR